MNTHPGRARRGRSSLRAGGVLLLLLWAGTAAAQPQEGLPPGLRPLGAPEHEAAGGLGREVTIRGQAMPLEEVLREIGRQAGLEVVFDTDVVAAQPALTLTLEAVRAATAIVKALEGTPLQAFVRPDGKVLVLGAQGASAGSPPPGALAAPGAPGQVVRGRVVDRDTRGPLPGASVVVLGTRPLLGTMTDADGRFVLGGVPLGRRDIQVSYVGYEPVVLGGLLVTSGKEGVVEAALREQVIVGAEVVVVPERRKEQPLNDMALVSARSFSVEETRRYAGGVDDPARMASAFAGVTTGAGIGDNAIVIRGNAPKGVLWRLEGVEIPNPSHFAGLTVAGGGGLTLFSSHLLADSDFFTGAFPAEYGNALAGVFDMNFRTGNPARREHAVQVGVLGLDVASEGPFRAGKPATYLFNYRYSTIALLLPLLPTEDVARYQDLSFKLSLPTRRAGRFEVWGIGGLDGQSMRAEQDSAKWEYETWDRMETDLSLGVGAAGASHHLALGRRSYLRSTAAVSANRTVWEQQRLGDDLVLADNLVLRNTTGRVVLAAYLNHKAGPRHVNRTGFAAQRLFYDFDLRVAPGDAPPPIPLSGGQGGSTLLQVYSQSHLDLSARVALNLGLHAQHFSLTGHHSVEPRAGLRWAFADRQALSLGYGLHSQIEELRHYFVARPVPAGPSQPNRTLGFARAHHAVLGYDRALGAAARLKGEVYYQYLFDVPVIADSAYSLLNFEQDWTFSEALVNEGAGENYGVEVTAERFLKDGYYFLLTGSVFSSRYRGGDGVWRRSRFDQRYAGNALFGKELAFGARGVLGVNARLMTTGGKRRSPVDWPASLARQEVVYDERRPFAERDPGLFLLDLTVTYRRNLHRRADVWALQVKNVLAAKDTYLDYNYALDAVEEIHEGFPVPVLSYKVEF